MCGIAGFIDFKRRLCEKDLRAMTDRLAHRGPDASGYLIRNLSNATVGLGHRRLSIIDLSEGGAQPKTRDKLHITFNGEIYNYAEIRTTLQKLGHVFYTNSDTEVILASFQQWGVDGVNKFIGMFAFVLIDENTGKAYLFRDRAGVKPLYIYDNFGLLLFASEIKSFHTVAQFKKDIDPDALHHYFQYGYTPTPHSIFKNCKKLEPGSYLEVDINKQTTRSVSYWNVRDAYRQPMMPKMDDVELLDETEKVLTSAFQYRMVADVPVGSFLSGGYDSSLVTAILQAGSTQKIKTFTIGFENDDYDESPHAHEVASHLGTDHTQYICTEQEAKDIIPQLPSYYDEPFGDSSAIPTTLISRLARRHVTVALSGDGGDELFAGYKNYHAVANLYSKLSNKPQAILGLAGQCIKTARNSGLGGFNQPFATKLEKAGNILSSLSPISIIYNQTQHLTENDLKKLIRNTGTAIYPKGNLTATDQMNSILAWDYRNYMMDDILVKVDRATMSVALEGREPFLDQRIVEWVARLSFKQKYRCGNLKYLLKEITHRYIPESIMERPKMGFGVPVMNWLKTDLRDLLEFYLGEEKIKQDGIFNHKIVTHQKNIFLQSDTNAHFEWIWYLLMFQMWKEKWL